jgi:ribosomal protein S18 acetylase RimI-like enzyme
VWGYYALANISVDIQVLPEPFQKALAEYDRVPAIRLWRLAVDRREQGRGLGTRLLASAVIRSASNVPAWALMMVDAKDDRACAFYRQFGFESLQDDARHLFAPRKDLECILEKT